MSRQLLHLILPRVTTSANALAASQLLPQGCTNLLTRSTPATRFWLPAFLSRFSAGGKALPFTSPPEPLVAVRQIDQPAPGVKDSILKRTLLRLAGYYSRESTLRRGAKGLYEAVTEQCLEPRFRHVMGLTDDKFATTHALMTLHVWMLLVRLRDEGRDGKTVSQLMYDEFAEDVEIRVRRSGVQVRVNKWLTELEKMFYGSCMAYDKVLKGEENLRKALMRNVYADDETNSKYVKIMDRYVRRELECVRMTPSTDVIQGQLRFSTDY